MSDSLFGHLAFKFQTQRENLATEALRYLLCQSQELRSGLIRRLAALGAELPSDLSFRTQASSGDNGIPDLVGEDTDGTLPLIVEAKFWAGLTPRQPNAYLDLLPGNRHGVLVVLSPSTRFATLWPELLHRISETGSGIDVGQGEGTGLRWARVSETNWIVLWAWSDLLDLLAELVHGDRAVALRADISQLAGLCAKMDTDAFLPLQPHELAPIHGRRVGQFCELVNVLVDELAGAGVVSTKGLRSASSSGRYGRYARIKGHGVYIYFTAWGWGWIRSTPLWMKLASSNWGSKWSEGKALREHLRDLERPGDPELVVLDDALLVALAVPTGEERDDVVQSLVRQVKLVAERLPERSSDEEVEQPNDADEEQLEAR